MNTIMDIDTDEAIRTACHSQDYKTISRLAMSAVDGLLDRGFYDCCGSINYPAVREYAEELLKTGELKYELAEQCVSYGIMYSSAPPHYTFNYSVPCKGFDSGDAWHAGISPAIYTKSFCLISDGAAPVPGAFDVEGRRMLLPLYSVSALPVRRGGAEVSFDVPVSAFASVLSGERYMELLHAVRKYSMQPEMRCMFLLFNDKGIKKLCRMYVESLMKGYAGEDKRDSGAVQDGFDHVVTDNPIRELPGNIELHEEGGGTTVLHGVELKEGPIPTTCSGSAEVTNEAQFCVNAAESDTELCDGEPDTAKREAMWKDCRRDLESAGVDPTPLEVGLYKVAPGTSLDLFVAGNVTALVSQCGGKVQEFTAHRGDRRTLVATEHGAAYMFVSGLHVAATRVRKDGTDTVSAAAPLPCNEYTVTEGKELMYRDRGTVLVGPLPGGSATMARSCGFERVGPGGFKVYGSRGMYLMNGDIDAECNGDGPAAGNETERIRSRQRTPGIV